MLFATTLAGCTAIPQVAQRGPVAAAYAGYAPAYAYAPVPQQTPVARACLADLGARRAAFTPLPDQYYGAGCATINSVRLAALSGDSASFALTNMGPVTCDMADRFAGWARFGVDRAARQVLGSALVRIETMGSYNCRNIAGSDRRSAHAQANAVDVSGFVLADGRRITVLGNWTQGTPAERQFLRLVAASACKRFGTVLGPEYNPAHRNHFHVEASGSAFCR
jgi:hypothetical protein